METTASFQEPISEGMSTLDTPTVGTTAEASTIIELPWKKFGFQELVCEDDLQKCDDPEKVIALLEKRLKSDPLKRLLERRQQTVRTWVQHILLQSSSIPHALTVDDGRRMLLRERLGRGAAGECWVADLEDEPEPIVAKIAVTDSRDQWVREHRLLSNVSFDRVPELRGKSSSGDHAVLCVEYVRGTTWESIQRNQEEAPASELLPLFLELTRTLSTVHQAGWIHGDIKPGNVLLGTTETQKKQSSWLIDFGLSRHMDDPPSPLPYTAGTPGYIDPVMLERAGQTDAAADVYAVGATFYRLYTGKSLFGKEWLSVLLEGRKDIDWFNRCILAKQVHCKGRSSRHPALETLIFQMLRSHGTGKDRRLSLAEVTERLEKMLQPSAIAR